jgi:quaternary ammonium compound-resistance protein SugE
VLVGMIWLGEAASVMKLVSIARVLTGIIGLQLSGDAH